MGITIKLREVRESKNISLNQLAHISGVSRAQLSKIELGESDPTLRTMCKIAHALNKKYYEIFVCDD